MHWSGVLTLAEQKILQERVNFTKAVVKQAKYVRGRFDKVAGIETIVGRAVRGVVDHSKRGRAEISVHPA